MHNLLRRAVGDDLGQVIERAIEALRREVLRDRFAATGRPRASGLARTDTRYIPADVQRAVFGRDGGSCAFVSEDGHRCGTDAFLAASGRLRNGLAQAIVSVL